jgi:hypothetical protein
MLLLNSTSACRSYKPLFQSMHSLHLLLLLRMLLLLK